MSLGACKHVPIGNILLLAIFTFVLSISVKNPGAKRIKIVISAMKALAQQD
jgi:hypothetical protein